MAPQYVIDNIEHYQPVDCVDEAHFKSPGTGCLLSRVTLSGARELVFISTSHFLLGECNWSVCEFVKADQKVFGNKLLGAERICKVDGGTALNFVLAIHYP
eukprot:2667646-Pleurochrysis_carterae.AAC.1